MKRMVWLFAPRLVISWRLFLLSSLLLLLAWMLASCDTRVDDAVEDDQPEGVKVGVIITQTGDTASYGSQMDDAVRLAAAEINDAGGVNGQPIELVLRDDKSSAEQGVAAAQNLRDAGVVAIIGAITSRVTLPMVEQVTIPAQLALISPSATSTRISELNDADTVYRTTPSDAIQGVVLARHLLQTRGVRQTAVVYVDDAYGSGLTALFAEHYLAGGGEITAQIALAPEHTLGFAAEIAALYAQGEPPALVLISFAQQTGNFLRELQSLRDSLPTLFGTDGNFDAAMFNFAPTVIVGMQGTSPAAPITDANYQRFATSYRQRLGHDSVSFGEAAYDALYLIALALQQAGENSRAAVVGQLRAVSRPDGVAAIEVNVNEFARARELIAAGADIDYQGASGPIDLDSNGDPSSGTYVIWEVVRDANGLLMFVQREVIAYP